MYSKVLTKVKSLGTLNGITEITGDEKKSIDALNTLFGLIKSRNKVVMPSFDEAILYTAREDTKHFKNAGAIIPNQLGKLCHHHSLHRDDRIPEELLEMQRVLIPGEDWRVQLADTRIQDIGLEPWKRDDVVKRMDGPIYLKQSKFTEGASEELKAVLTNFVDYCDKHALSQLIPRTRLVYSKLSPSTLEESVQKGQISLEKFNNRQQSAIRRLIEQMEQLPEDRKEMTMSILEMTPEQQIEMVSLYQKHKKDREATIPSTSAPTNYTFSGPPHLTGGIYSLASTEYNHRTQISSTLSGRRSTTHSPQATSTSSKSLTFYRVNCQWQ